MVLNETGNPTPVQSKSCSNLLSLVIHLGFLPISSHLIAAITDHLKHSRSEFFGLLLLSCELTSLVGGDS